MGDLEKELDEKVITINQKDIRSKGTRRFIQDYEWVQGGSVPDGIKPYTYEHRKYMIFQTFIAKYAQSLAGGKVVLRDVIVGKTKSTKEDGKDIQNDNKKKNYNKSQYKHSRNKGGTKKAGKGKKKSMYD